MNLPGFDPQTLVDQFAQASAKQADQLRKAVHDATLAALRGREMTIKNVRAALKAVSSAASQGAAQNQFGVDAEDLLDKAVAGMDDALVKAVDANRVALQQLASQGADLRDKQLKKALDDLEKFEDMLFGAGRKAAEDAGAQLGTAWSQVMDKFQMGGTQTGAKANAAVEQVAQQMQSAVRQGRAASLKAAQALAESYAALASGVLIGMSDALRQGTAAAPAPAPAAAKKRR